VKKVMPMPGNGLEIRFPKYRIVVAIENGRVNAYIPEKMQGDIVVEDIFTFLRTMVDEQPGKLDEIHRAQNWVALEDWFERWRSSRDDGFVQG
jgi:hypothetical protein